MHVISLIIHEGKTNEISAITEVVYVIHNLNPPDLRHKLFVRFFQPESFNIVRIFDAYEHLHAFGIRITCYIQHSCHVASMHVVTDTQSRAFGSSLYIRYNMRGRSCCK